MKSQYLGAAMMCAYGVASASPAFAQNGARHVLNLEEVDMGVLVQDVSMVTGQTFILDPDVRGKVSITSTEPMTSDEVFQVFLATLRVHGYTAVPSGRGVYTILPEQSAVGQAGLSSRAGDAFVTEIIPLTHFNAVEAAQMVKPIIDAQGQAVATANSNMLVVVDYASNLPRVRALVAELDRDRAVVETLPLTNIPATEMQQILTAVQGGGGRRGDSGGAADFTAIASETSNAIILRGDEPSVRRALRIARELDQTDPTRDNLRIIPLSHARGDELVPILEQVGRTVTDQAGPADNSRATIAYHEQTNSLVVSADRETLLAMERVVEALDVRRAQVLVEAIIVEISDDTARELGLQFLLAGSDGEVPFVSTNFSNSAPSLLALTGALVGDELVSPDGADTVASNPFVDSAVSSLLAANGITAGIGGESGDTLFGVILNAVQTDTESNVLSTPSILTLDNQTSSIFSGQQIPVNTGAALGDANLNPFITVERIDVGILLDVTPNIGEDGSVRLDIRQEVASIAAPIGDLTTDFITNRREIATTVVANDGELIVLGGLIQESDTVTQEKVPLLGDIPGIGRLFEDRARGIARSNLMVFIRPTIVRDQDDARATTERTYNYIRAEQLYLDDDEVPLIDRFLGEVLGAEPPGGPLPPTPPIAEED